MGLLMSNSRRGFLRSAGAGILAGALPGSFGGAATATESGSASSNREAGVILLNNNENAYGPSPKVLSRIQEALAASNRYPSSDAELASRLATAHRVTTENVLLGCGSTEILRAATCALLAPGKTLITAAPTFEAMAAYAKTSGATILAVRLDHEFSHDLPAMLERVDESTSVIYICNPNNPTGSITPRAAIERFVAGLRKDIVVVVDEAYHHYTVRSAMYSSFLDNPIVDDRLLVLRTFSTVYGLAGLRIGYGIASTRLAARIRPFLTDVGVNELATQAALAAIDDDDGLRLAVKRNANDRQEFFNQAMARMLKPIDSKTNFVMMDTHHPAQIVIEHFRTNNVILGPYYPQMDRCIRVSLGTPAEMTRFWQVWDLLPDSNGVTM